MINLYFTNKLTKSNTFKKIFFLLISLILFLIGFLVINKFYKYIPLHENTITDYIQGDDLPFFKNTFVFFDLAYSLIFFIIIFYFLDKIKNCTLNYNLKIIWILKNIFSLFLILIYEKNAGLDQVIYFDIISNEKYWAQHYGYIHNFFTIENATSNFLLPFKFLNTFLFSSWFVFKIFLNLVYLFIIYFSYKIFIKFNKENSSLVVYFFALFPSLFFFSSIITKDLFILFYIVLSFYCFQKIGDNFVKNIFYFSIIFLCLGLIMTIRIWMGPIILISLLLPGILKFIFFTLIKLNKYIFIFFITTILIFFLFFIESNYWNDMQISIIASQFDRIHNWHAWDPSSHNIIGVNSENFKQLLINDYWKMFFLSIFNPFLNYLNKIQFLPFILENILILFLIFYSCFNISQLNTKIVYTLIFFTLGYGIVYAYAGGFLNAGTSLRYSIQLKYILFIYLLTLNFKSLKNHIKKYKSKLLKTSINHTDN